MTDRSPLPVPHVLWTLAATAAVFALDLLVPLGVAGGVLYVLVVSLALSVPRRAFVVAAAVVCSFLTLLGLLWSPDPGGTEFWKVLANRFLALFAIWLTTIFGLVWMRYHERQELPVALLPPEPVAAASVAEFRYRRTLFWLSGLFLIGGSLLLWHQTSTQSGLVESMAVEDARAYSEALATFRRLYTSEVVEPARKMGIVVTHDYKSQDGAIPLPATLSMELGKRIGEERTGIVSRLYSPYPFPWRRIEGGLTDDFEKQAWAALSRNPDEPFYRFEESSGQSLLRYASADKMRESCVDCHNTRTDSPKTNWKVGDVRGVLEVVVPMDHVTVATASRFRQTAGVWAGLGALAVCSLALVIGRLDQVRFTLREQVREQTSEITAMHQDARLAAVAFETHDSIVITDNKGKILQVNQSFTDITGYLPEEVIGKTPRVLKSGRHGEGFYREMWRTIHTNGYWEGEVWNKRKDGQIYPQRLTINAVKNAAGETTHYVGDGQDLTSEKRAAVDRAAIQAASLVQQALFPSGPPCLPGFDIAGAVLPAEHASGDFFDYIDFGQNSVGVLVADVSGHGLGAALMAAQTQAYLRAQADSHTDPGDLLTQANRLFAKSDSKGFVTAHLCRLDVETRSFVHASAGHAGYLIRANGETTVLETPGLPLGIEAQATVPSAPPIDLEAGDIILLPTDGVEEAHRRGRPLFGRDRMFQVVRDNREKSAADIVDALLRAAQDFEEGEPQNDDITAVVVKTVGS